MFIEWSAALSLDIGKKRPKGEVVELVEAEAETEEADEDPSAPKIKIGFQPNGESK